MSDKRYTVTGDNLLDIVQMVNDGCKWQEVLEFVATLIPEPLDEIGFKADLFRALYDGFGFIDPKACDTITETTFEILKAKGYLPGVTPEPRADAILRSWDAVGRQALAKFDELAHKGWEWRSFYNGFIEGTLSERSGKDVLPKGGSAEEKEHDGQAVESNLPGLPVADQVRLFRASGGSVDGARRLRAKLEATQGNDVIKDRKDGL